MRVLQDLLSIHERCFHVDPGTGSLLAEIESRLRRPPADPFALHNLLCRLLEMTIDGGRRYAEADLPRFAPVVQYIDEHLDRTLRVAELARVAGLSESRFKAAFKHAFGVSPAEYVTRERVERAKIRLQASDSSVTDIALELGFSTPQYFSYVFRRFTGSSPRAFRRRNRKRG